MSQPLISIQGVGKCYPESAVSGSRTGVVCSLLAGRRSSGGYRALEDINMKLYAGESLGVVGVNGAGKSTLLKIIAGVVKPSEGVVKVDGRIGALLELGSGFHPEYTGMENVRLSATLMGLSHDEIHDKVDDIIDFADIGEHIDQPIKHYSSGMIVRLGFAIATTMKPDILITDEVLAVGDESFQKKCIRWMESYLADGGTLLLCSHGMYHIQKLCQKAVWIHDGRVQSYGESGDVTREYLAWHERQEREKKEAHSAQQDSGGAYVMQNLWIENDHGIPESSVSTRDGFTVCGSLRSPDDRAPVAAVGIFRQDGSLVYAVSSEMDKFVTNRVGSQLYAFRIRFKGNQLLPNHYIVRGSAMDPEGIRLFGSIECVLQICGNEREHGLAKLKHEWEEGCQIEAKEG